MPDESPPPRKLSLTQRSDGEDHAARILREKIGDVLSFGNQPAPLPPLRAEGLSAPDQQALEQKIVATLQTIYDPEIPLNIYDLGLIYRIAIEPSNAVRVEMTLTAPGCPVAGDIVAQVKRKIEAIPEVPAVVVELVWDPPWSRDRLSEAARLDLGLM
jgi:FeS assembly SUF system protein